MGINKASMTALSGASADQWKEVFICGEMDSGTLNRRAGRQLSQNGGNRGSSNVITAGSVIIVGEGVYLCHNLNDIGLSGVDFFFWKISFKTITCNGDFFQKIIRIKIWKGKF